MISEKIPVNNLSDLPLCAKHLLESFPSGRIFAIFGEMGAGKTTLIKEFCKQLGVTDQVSSPTFALVYEYRTAKDNPVYHFDFYRVNNEKEALDIGVQEYFSSGNYCFLEWPEKVLNLLPEETVQLNMDVLGDKRLITYHHV